MMASPFKLFLVLLIVLLIFGAGKLPQIGDNLGRAIKNFKKAVNDKDTLDAGGDKSLEKRPKADEDGETH